MEFSTPKGLTAKAKMDHLLVLKQEIFLNLVAKPLDIKYTTRVINAGSPTASIIFDLEWNHITGSIHWSGDSIVLHCNNQNRITKDSYLSPQWVVITLATLAAC